MNTQKSHKGRISPRQIKLIHTLKGKIGMDDDAYRLLLAQSGVESCKNLTWYQAECLVEELNRKSGNPRNPPASLPPLDKGGLRGVKKYADLDGRPGMCSGKQGRMIAGMWAEVSWAETDEERERALWSFLRRITRVDHFRFLKGWQVQAVVKAIETMKAAQKGGRCPTY